MSSLPPEGQLCSRGGWELAAGALGWAAAGWPPPPPPLPLEPGAPEERRWAAWRAEEWWRPPAPLPAPVPLVPPAPARCCWCRRCCCCRRLCRLCSCGRLIPSRELAEEPAPPERAGEARAAAASCTTSAAAAAASSSSSRTMPAIKRERPDREELALAAFNQPMETLPDYLVPLAAAAIPVVTPHPPPPPPPYEQLFAAHQHPPPPPPPPRAYLGGFPEGPPHAAHSHPPPLPEDLMLERFSSIPDFQPFFDNGEPCLEVECGENKALLYIHKLCQGSKGPSIRYRGEWLTPNEFQFVSGRETAKDWKRSIRHKGKSLKTLMSKGILQE
ncbi:UNVERIFIED_CONTAM: hypothetical protein K2H54_007453 [Gekko kuhli]